MSDHTPGPWDVEIGRTFVQRSTGNRLGYYHRSGDDMVSPYEADQNARRLVACLNACEGMDDPEAEIRQLHNQIKLLKKMLTE